ncbi:hypothetical protein NF681_21010 (plasmid) [Comamonadaceae bacterium OTU4NAUVB1]|nr:hypothetical protein NF681_21010 [Comamonadaceae bacterium OTU4NAUVB1]
MTTLIKAAELWIPDADGQILELSAGLYGAAGAFGFLSRGMCFGRGEGLPGKAWEERRPILLKDLQSGPFRRAEAARAAGLSCAVAHPVFVEQTCKAVVLLFCGDVQAEVGALELWRNDPRVTPDMTLADGYYGATPGGFETASGETYLERGTGLPGLAWQHEASVYFPDLSRAAGFPRAAAAASAGIRSGMAIPCPVPGRENYALSFLWPADVPVARRVESWTVAAAGHPPTLAYRFDAGLDGADDANAATGAAGAAGETPGAAVARALATALPQVEAAPGPGHHGVLALPIVIDTLVAEVVAFSL